MVNEILKDGEKSWMACSNSSHLRSGSSCCNGTPLLKPASALGTFCFQKLHLVPIFDDRPRLVVRQPQDKQRSPLLGVPRSRGSSVCQIPSLAADRC